MLNFLYAFVLVMGTVYLVTVIHESGHFVAAHKLGMPISSVDIGRGPVVFSFLWKGIRFRQRLIPINGQVKLVYSSGTRWKNLVMTAAGPLANVMTAGVVYALYDRSIFVDASLLIGLLNLVPMHLGGTPSDGLRIIRLLQKKKSTA